jgi:signal transduction histidine kinase
VSRSVSATQGQQALRPRARILATFGDELISSERVAVTELVKNSYDADATRVVVRFVAPLELGKGAIEIIDNGHGMSLDTIRSAWMEPATTHRQRNRLSESGRRTVLGEKGIGRFATARLGRTLELVTRRTDSQNEVQAYFDWSQFDDPDRYLDEVEVLWEERPAITIRPDELKRILYTRGERPNENDVSHGTILRMESLRAEWDVGLLEELRRSLSRLISPTWDEHKAEGDQFSIRLDVPEQYAEVAGIVRPPDTLHSPRYTVGGQVQADGSYDLTFQTAGNPDQHLVGTFRLQKRREPLQKGGEPPQKGVEAPQKTREPQCGPFVIDLRVWDRDAGAIGELAHVYSVSVANVRHDLDEASGISIYRDGFRVFPYGEPHQDWLRLDLRRVQNPTLRLSNNQIVGVISISREANPQLRDQSNREGLMEGAALDDLRDLVKLVLNELETRRYALRRATRGDSKKPGLFRDFDLVEIRQAIQDRHAEDTELLAAIVEKETDLERRVAQVQEVLARYRRLATLGQLVDRILHDGRTPLAKIGNEADLALRDIERAQKVDRDLVGKLHKRLLAIAKHRSTLDSLLTRIEPFGGRQRGRPTQLRLEQVIADAFAVLETEIAEVGAKVTLPEGTTVVTVERAEIEQVIINLLQNSLFWLQQVPKDRRAILVDVSRTDQEVIISFSDSGPGVAPEFVDQIFEPYFSTKPDGIGLGLTIVGEIVTDYYGGDVVLVDAGPLGGATFRVTLRRRI